METKQLLSFNAACCTQLTDNDSGCNYDVWNDGTLPEMFSLRWYVSYLPDPFACGTMCMSSKSIYYMDSITVTSTVSHVRTNSVAQGRILRIEKYINDVTSYVGKWNKYWVDVPQQINGHDCGVNFCMYAYWTCFLDELPNFDQVCWQYWTERTSSKVLKTVSYGGLETLTSYLQL